MQLMTKPEEEQEVVPSWMTITDAAKLIGIHRRTLMRWCESGELGDDAKQVPAGRGRWFVRRSWVEEMGRLE